MSINGIGAGYSYWVDSDRIKRCLKQTDKNHAVDQRQGDSVLKEKASAICILFSVHCNGGQL